MKQLIVAKYVDEQICVYEISRKVEQHFMPKVTEKSTLKLSWRLKWRGIGHFELGNVDCK